MRNLYKTKLLLLIAIFSLNFLTVGFDIQEDDIQDSSNTLSKLLRSFGLFERKMKEDKETPMVVPRLTNAAVGSTRNISSLGGIKAKVINSIEDCVDNNDSNVDGLVDKGTHSNFSNQQVGPNSLYDTLTEEDTNTINQIDLEIDSFDITRNAWVKTGASPFLDNQTQPSINNVYGKSNAAGSKDGDEMGNFGFEDIAMVGTISSVKLRIYGQANPTFPTDSYFSVHLGNSSSWSEVMNFSGEPNLVWKEVDVSTLITTWSQINETTIFLRTEDPGDIKYGEHLCDIAILRINYLPQPNYELDVEVQWTSAENTTENAELAIYAGNLGIEAMKIDVWNGSAWKPVMANLIPNSWNNFSIKNYLNSSVFTIRFKGTNESLDTSQDQYNIDTSLLRTWDTDETPPVINFFGIDDLGIEVGTFWANITDNRSDVESVTLEVNNSQFFMIYNGSQGEPGLWVSQVAVNFSKYHSYRILNASDTAGNYLSTPSEYQNHTFILDNIAPEVDDWEYYADIGYNGTFSTNVSDSWGEIDTVVVNVTEIDGIPRNDLWAVMGLTTSGYLNNTIFLEEDIIFKFTIIVNDTSGNSFTSLEHTGAGPNHPPEASNLSLTLNPRNNETLHANWTFYDIDGNNESLNWIIRWYKYGIHQIFHDNAKLISSSATLKGEVWNYTLQVSDGSDYSPQYNSPITTIINTAPEAIDITITPAPTSNDELVAGWTALDIDGDNPNDFLNITIIRWYRWTGTWTHLPELMNSTYITAGNLTRGQIYRFELWLFDGEEYSSQGYLSPNTTILNSLPVLTDIPSFNKTIGVTDSDTINITYVYNDSDDELTEDRIVYWYRNGQFNSSKTNDTILLSSETKDEETWQYIIRVYDGLNYSLNYTSILISIGSYTNNIPEIQNITLIGGSNTTSETLIVSYDYFDADGHQPVETEIFWYQDGILKSNLNNSLTVDSSLTNKGQTWNFTVRVFDGLNWSIQCNSSLLLIQNSIPQALNLQITPNTTTIYNLTINWGFFDADGDVQEDFSIKWYIDGFLNSSFNDFNAISSDITEKGQEWLYSVRLYDGQNYSSWYNSSSTFILNTPPSLLNLGLQGGENNSNNLILIYNFVDADNDTENEVNTLIEWFYINGTIIPGQNNLELSSSYFLAGDILSAQITPNDGSDSGNIYQTNYLQIGNAKPAIIGTPNILGFDGKPIYFAAAPLFVNYTTEDLDNPIFIYDIEIDENELVVGSNYRWYRNGNIISGLTNPTVSTFHLSEGDIWLVSVQPRDRYGDFGSWVNSSPIIIGNTPPDVTSFVWTTDYPTAQNDLSFSYTYFDFDYDSEWRNQTIINWYKNGTEVLEAANQIFLSNTLFNRGDSINVSLRVSDGENSSLIYNSTVVVVGNALPEAHNLGILPNSPYTYDTLFISWDFVDYDGDNESSDYIVQWERNGILVPSLANNTNVNATFTAAGENWIAYLRIYDYIDYSEEYTLFRSIILNSAPQLISASLNENINESYADSNLYLSPYEDITFYDADNDPIIDYMIFWVKNFEFQLNYTDQSSIPVSELSKGDKWFVIVRVFDGEDWSGNQSSQEVFIVNKAPEIMNIQFINRSYSEFVLEKEDIILTYSFQDLDNDSDSSLIRWYRNQTYLHQFDDLSELSANVTSPGDVWYVEIQPYDNEAYGSLVNFSFTVESLPTINEIGIEVKTDKEGHYNFWVNASDTRNPISEIFFDFIFQNLTLDQTKWAEPNGTENFWIIDYQLDNYSYLGNLVTVEVTAMSVVFYSASFEIPVTKSFDFLMEDEVAPRVIDAYFEKDDDLNPEFLTFYAQIEELGVGVDEVVLYYYFQPITSGSGANSIEWTRIPMIFQNRSSTNDLEYWSVLIEFNHNNSNFEILYNIYTKDNSGNDDPLAFDIRDFPQRIYENRFIYTSQGLPEEVLIVAIFTVLCILVGSITYIKFIRKPELVGLDKDFVMKNINKISDEEVMLSLDLHTLGIIVSYFDQHSGPIPLIVIPDLLKDNITPLINLSDRSFNSCGFVEDFTSKTFSSFDFLLSTEVRINSMSFGYSIGNPEARGGAEHYTVNILSVPEIFPLINQFKEELQKSVHDLHMLMTNEPEEKRAILQLVIKLRKKVSYIVLSYKEIYKTTELIDDI